MNNNTKQNSSKNLIKQVNESAVAPTRQSGLRDLIKNMNKTKDGKRINGKEGKKKP